MDMTKVQRPDLPESRRRARWTAAAADRRHQRGKIRQARRRIRDRRDAVLECDKRKNFDTRLRTEERGWTGKQIELTLGTVKFNGEPQDAVIVKPISPPIASDRRSSEMDDEIPFE